MMGKPKFSYHHDFFKLEIHTDVVLPFDRDALHFIIDELKKLEESWDDAVERGSKVPI